MVEAQVLFPDRKGFVDSVLNAVLLRSLADGPSGRPSLSRRRRSASVETGGGDRRQRRQGPSSGAGAPRPRSAAPSWPRWPRSSATGRASHRR